MAVYAIYSYEIQEGGKSLFYVAMTRAKKPSAIVLNMEKQQYGMAAERDNNN